jgi:hypothetical protein
MKKEMTSKQLAEIFVKNINIRINEIIEKINKDIAPLKIEHEEIFGIDWIKSLQSGVDTVINNELIKNPNYSIDKKLIQDLDNTKPYYLIGTDNYDKDVFCYCLCRKIDNNIEVILSKRIKDKKQFYNEVENIAKYFDVDISNLNNNLK